MHVLDDNVTSIASLVIHVNSSRDICKFLCMFSMSTEIRLIDAHLLGCFTCQQKDI